MKRFVVKTVGNKYLMKYHQKSKSFIHDETRPHLSLEEVFEFMVEQLFKADHRPDVSLVWTGQKE